MAKLVRDAHLYFFNKDFSPRSDATFRVRDELRKRFLDAVIAVKDGDRPVVVVSHSMGTIIAYDCLMHEPERPSIDGLVTIGSPLGLDEVQDFFPKWTRENGFPTRAPERPLGQCVRPARRRRRRRSGHRQRLPSERPRGGRGSGGTQLGRVAAQHQQVPARQEAPGAARADARGGLAMSSIDELIAAIQVATKSCAKGEAQAAIQAFAAMPASGAAQPDETTAQSLLLGFNERRWFDLSAQLGQAWPHAHRMSTGMRQCYAQALVERGRLADARAQLELVVQAEDVAASERAEARGLIARSYKQEFIDQLRATSTASAPTLEQAVTTYLKEYKDDPPVRDWQGINAVALLALAQRQGLAAAAIADPKALAGTHRQEPAGEARAHAVRRGHARGSIRGAGRYDEAAERLQKYVWHPNTSAFSLGSTLRQFEQVWELDTPGHPGQTLLTVLRARLIEVEQGAVTLASGPGARGDTQTQTRRARFHYEKVFGKDHFVTLENYRTGLERCKCIARIGRELSRGEGTGFLLRGSDLSSKVDADPVLITNCHVIDPSGTGEGLHPDEVVISFQALDGVASDQAFTVKQVLWSSPQTQLDATILTLSGPLPLTTPYPLRKEPAGPGRQGHRAGSSGRWHAVVLDRRQRAARLREHRVQAALPHTDRRRQLGQPGLQPGVAADRPAPCRRRCDVPVERTGGDVSGQRRNPVRQHPGGVRRAVHRRVTLRRRRCAGLATPQADAYNQTRCRDSIG